MSLSLVKSKRLRFYIVIIGTEILNGRREDAHFEFVRKSLNKYNHEIHSLSIIKDDSLLIEQSFLQAKNDKNAILFSFGGIGSTPDDITRKISADVFRNSKMQYHPKFMDDIKKRFGDVKDHRIQMAYLPTESKLLKNPINNMSGFYLDERYFFVPGFPQMAHPMIEQALNEFIPKEQTKYRRTLSAKCSENTLIDLMLEVPTTIEISSLPAVNVTVAEVTISLISDDKELTTKWFNKFKDYLNKNQITFVEAENL